MLLLLIPPVVICLTSCVPAYLNNTYIKFYTVICEVESDVKMMMAAGRIKNFDVGRGSGNSHIPLINPSMPALLHCKDF